MSHHSTRRAGASRHGLARPAILLAVLAGAPFAALTQPSFTDIALETGFQDRLGHGRTLVAADFNGDGLTDYYIGNPGRPGLRNEESFILLANAGNPDTPLSFTKGQVLLNSVIAFTASAADYDNDGDPDLFVGVGGQEGIGFDRLFRNDDGVLIDVSDAAGIAGPRKDGQPVPTASISGTWTDFDKDGDLDLFVASKISAGTIMDPSGIGWRDRLYRNDGDDTFTDVTALSGLGGISSKAASWGDYDNNGWPDLFMPTEISAVQPEAALLMFRNNQDGTFDAIDLDERALDIGETNPWTSCASDFDNDGWLDIIVPARPWLNKDTAHMLLINLGDFRFRNDALSTGLVEPGATMPQVMGSQIGDLNNDGFPDVFMGNGNPVAGEADTLHLSDFRDGVLTFEDASHLIDFPAPEDPDCVDPLKVRTGSSLLDPSDMSAGSADDPDAVHTSTVARRDISLCRPPYPYRGHGTAMVDIDRDGDLDMAMVKGGTAVLAPDIPSTEPNRLFRNDGGNASNWLFVELDGVVSNRDAIGARVDVVATAKDGSTHRVYREVRAGSCFSASGPRELHFGLGNADVIEAINIYWPSGFTMKLTDAQVGTRVRVAETFTRMANFNDGTAAGWETLAGQAAVIDRQLVQSSDGAAVTASNWQGADFEVTGKLTYLDGALQMALGGRLNADGSSYYAVLISAAGAKLVKRVDGVLTTLGDTMTIPPMRAGRSYIVTLRAEGASLAFAVDRRWSAVIQDTDLSLAGSLGLITQGSSAAFDNLVVR